LELPLGAGEEEETFPEEFGGGKKDDDYVADTPLAGPAAWFSLEDRVGVRCGDEVPEPPAELRRGHRGLSPYSAGLFVCAVKALKSEQESFRRPAAQPGNGKAETPASSSDARTLPIASSATGRHRDFKELSGLCEEEPFPLKGPRTASWCLQFLRRRHTPSDHHLQFRTTARLQPDSWGMGEHEQLLKLIELAGSYDQLDLTNLSFAEAAFRRIQMIEWVYHEKVRDSESSGGGDKLTPEEWSAFFGASRAGDILLVCPQLLSHVRSEVEIDAAIMKRVRKAREERELKRGSNRARAKGKGTAADDK
jgi:hypothetical protein